MALTLAEAEKYSTNQVLVGVAEISMDANPLLAMLPFIPVRGNALQHQRELAASASSDADANESDGVHQIIEDDVTGQQVHTGADATPDPGSFTLLDQLIDLVRPRPHALLASRRSIPGIPKLAP